MVLSPTCVKKKKERKKTYPPPFRGNLDWPVVVCWCVELVSAARGGRRENACPVLFSGVCAAEQCTPRLPRFGEKPAPVTREGREPPSRGRRLACTSLSATLRVASPEAFPAQHRQGAGAEAEPWQKVKKAVREASVCPLLCRADARFLASLVTRHPPPPPAPGPPKAACIGLNYVFT